LWNRTPQLRDWRRERADYRNNNVVGGRASKHVFPVLSSMEWRIQILRMKDILKGLNLTMGQVEKVLLAKMQAKPKVLNSKLSGKVVKFGVVSDTHLCSNEEKLDELYTFYKYCEGQGIKRILHAGDILCGWRIYKGQEGDVKVFGARGQADYVVDNYPRLKGGKTLFINGNHDEAWWKLAGVDTGDLIANARDDMVYLGFHQADVLMNGIRVRLLHPDGGCSYALSAKGQKIAETIPYTDNVKLLVIGHYHIAHYFWYKGMHVLGAGCFEGQTSFLLRKQLIPAVGGWIVELKLGERDGDVAACKTTFIPFHE